METRSEVVHFKSFPIFPYFAPFIHHVQGEQTQEVTSSSSG